MGIFSFFFRSPLGLIGSLVSFLITVIAVGVLVTVLLAYAGGPGGCTPGVGAIELSDAQAASFDQKWDQLDAALDGGVPTTISLSESEISSRAERYARQRGGDIRDIRVCLHDGKGEATGKADAFFGRVKFKVTGTVDLTGEHPVVKFDDVKVGKVPSAVLAPFEGAVEDAIKDLLDDIALKHTYAPALKEGSAEISGTP